jgi:hypothetical protein
LPGCTGYNGRVTDEEARAMAARFRTTLELCALGEAIQLANLRREHPNASGDDIEAMFVEWLGTRPGAEHGDSWGRPIPWPPSRR